MRIGPSLPGPVVAALVILASAVTAAQPYKVCIDPGHGGTDPGAVGCGLAEADITLKVGLLLEGLMAADPDLTPLMTRKTDVFVSLQNRADYANDNGADRFASIHANAYNGQVSGIETFCYTYGSMSSFDQRDRIQAEMLATWPNLPDRGGKTAGFAVIKNTSMPATLSELAFIDYCAADALLLADPAEQLAAAGAHHTAIRESLGLEGPIGPVEKTGILRGIIFEDLGVGAADMSVRIPGTLVKALAQDGKTVEAVADDPTASWAFSLKPGTYTVTAAYEDYYDGTRVCEVLPDQETWCSIGLVPLPEIQPPDDDGTLLGAVYEETGAGTGDMSIRIPGALVTVDGGGGSKTTLSASNPDALWETLVSPGTYTVTASYQDYYDGTRVCQVLSGQETWCSIGLVPLPGVQPPDDEGILLGLVYEDTGAGAGDTSVRLPGALVTVEGSQGPKLTLSVSVPDALWETLVAPGAYTVTATHEGYYPSGRTCTAVSGSKTWCSVGLFPLNPTPDTVTVEPWWPDVPVGPPDVPAAVDPGTDAMAPAVDLYDAPGAEGVVIVNPVDASESEGSGGGTCHAHRGGTPDTAILWLGLLTLVFMIAGRRRSTGLIVVLLALAGSGCHSPVEMKPGRVTGMVQRGTHLVLTNAAPLTGEAGYTQPVWAPDGESIAFAGEGFGALNVVPAAGGEPVTLATGRSSGYAPEWRADGEAIAYRAPGQRRSHVPALAVHRDGTRARPPHNVTPGRWALVLDDAVYLRSGSRETRLSAPGDRHCCVVTSRDGRFVAFLGLSTGLHLYDSRSDRMTRLGAGNHPRFSPDGTWLAWDRCTDDGERLTACSLYLADLSVDGPLVREIRGTPPLARHPDFTPRGRHLAFESEGAIWVGSLE